MAKKKDKGINPRQLAEIKDKLGQIESAVKQVPIATIKIDEATLKKDQILIMDQPVRVGRYFFAKLGSMLRINQGLTKNMIKNGDTAIAAALMNGLKDYMAKNNKDAEVCLIANVSTKEVVDICKPNRYRRVTNSTIFDLTEKILDTNDNLIIESIDYNSYNGKASINILNDDVVEFAQLGSDDSFKFGFSIIQTLKDTIVETYNQTTKAGTSMRVSLGGGKTDGIISFEDKFRLGGTSAEDIKQFLLKVDAMKKAGFVPPGFEEAIVRAVTTKASLNEIEKAFYMAHDMVDEQDPDLLKRHQSSIARGYFPGYGSTLQRLANKKADGNKLNERAKQFVKTNMSIWDVVQSMTFLGSNNSGHPLKNQHELKYAAGELFAKGVKDGFDLEYAQYAEL